MFVHGIDVLVVVVVLLVHIFTLYNAEHFSMWYFGLCQRFEDYRPLDFDLIGCPLRLWIPVLLVVRWSQEDVYPVVVLFFMVVPFYSSTSCSRGRMHPTFLSQWSHPIIPSMASRSTTLNRVSLPRPQISTNKPMVPQLTYRLFSSGTGLASFIYLCRARNPSVVCFSVWS